MAKVLSDIDPNVKVPAAVKAAAAKSQGAFEAAYGKAEAEKAAKPVKPPKTEVTAEPVVEAVTEPVVEVAEPKVTPEVTPVVEPVKEPVVATPAPTATDQTWEHKYNSMKGRHDRLQDQMRSMSEQLTNTQGLLAKVQSTPAATPTELSAKSLLTPEQVAEYGNEFLDVVGKKAVEQLSPEVAALKAEIAQLRQNQAHLDSSQTQSNRTRMFADLNTSVPDWKTINDDQNFLNWLALPDTYSGAIRHELLKAAYERCDTPRVVAFFKGFLAEEAATAPRESGPDLTAPATPPVTKVPLETFAAPGRAKSTAAAPEAPVEKPVFTNAQISSFYADSIAGKYRGREAEKNRIEAQIFEAQREGRIR